MTTTVTYNGQELDLTAVYPENASPLYVAEVAKQFNELVAESADPHLSMRLSKVIARKAMETHSPAFDATTLVHKPGIMTMAVDPYYRVYYDDFIVMLWMAQARAVSNKFPCASCRATSHHEFAYTAGVFVHETEHPTRKHSKRFVQGSYEAKKWNQVADLEINDDLLEIFAWIAVRNSNVAKMCLPPEGAYPHTTKDINGNTLREGLTAEAYYALVPDPPPPPPPPPGGGSGPPQPGEPEPGQGQPTLGQPSDDHGSGVDGRPRPWDQGPPSAEAPGVETEDVDEIAQQISENIKQAKGRGALPGRSGAYTVKVAKQSRVNYLAMLKRLIQNEVQKILGDDHRTWARLSTQSWVQDDVIIPGQTDYALNVGVLSDVSGSMDSHALAVTKMEVAGLLKAVGATVHAVTCDTRVMSRMQVNNISDFKLQRGGGTNLVYGFTDLAAMKNPKLDIILCYTDGETPWPLKMQLKGIPVIVALVGGSTMPESSVPSWMKCIRVPEV